MTVIVILGIIAFSIWYVGKKSTSCGVMLAMLAALALVIFLILTAEVTFHVMGN